MKTPTSLKTQKHPLRSKHKNILRAFVFSCFFTFVFYMAPLSAFAQAVCKKNLENLSGIFKYLTCFLNKAIIPILALLSWVVFIYGVFVFIRGAGDEKARQEGKKFILWGIVALFVLVSIWGIINILGATLGTEGVTAPPLQQQP